jgi:hypothetical protein
MARIWHEGFEDGLPYNGYLEGNPNSQHFKTLSMPEFPARAALGSGRNIYSKNSLYIIPGHMIQTAFYMSLSELYFRTYYKKIYNNVSGRDTLNFIAADGNTILYLYGEGYNNYTLYVKKGGVTTNIGNVVITSDMWTKVEVRLKISSSVGAYELRINDITIYSESGINTGSSNIATIKFGHGYAAGDGAYWDDMALNDITGAINNSWCGNGTILSLKPKASGNKAQWVIST